MSSSCPDDDDDDDYDEGQQRWTGIFIDIEFWLRGNEMEKRASPCA